MNSATERDRLRLATLMDRLDALPLRLLPPHERSIAAVARQALCDEIHIVARRLDDGSYWRGSRLRAPSQRLA